MKIKNTHILIEQKRNGPERYDDFIEVHETEDGSFFKVNSQYRGFTEIEPAMFANMIEYTDSRRKETKDLK